MLKGTKLYSVINNKCPKCQQADFFMYKNPFNLKTFDKMHDKCFNCGESFTKEIGFYYGAMYVSYGVNITIGIALFLITVLLFKMPLLVYLFIFLGISIVSFPIIMRVSRLIYINIFVKFNKDKSVK